MGGIGKTTLAQWIFNSNKREYKSNSFVDKIGENYKHGSLIMLQKKLLKDISGNKNVKISDAVEGTSKIAEVLQRKKVFIVLDDIDDQEQLNTLLGTRVFHAECKIIITTRLRNIDAWFASSSKSSRCKVHELNSLNNEESLELFNWHAFPSKILIKGFQELAKQLTKYCGGNPLALRVLGSSLLFSDEDPSKRKDIIKIWRDRMNSLNSSKGDLDSSTQEVLRKSFDSLPLERHKDLFLHIACFFVGECEEHVISILQDDLHAQSGIMVLINRCLLIISDSGHIVMHQLLQEMGRKIVCAESKDPAKRSRVWDDDESYHVLEKGDGSDTIEGLLLDINKVKQKVDKETTTLQTSSVTKMDKLKLLQLKYVKLTGSYENFPKLRWLCWHGCPLETMFPGLLKSSLVNIDMSYGNMKKFEVPTVLNSLKILNLKECDELVSICKVDRVPKLEELLLSRCSRLTHICEFVGDLKSLALLDLKGCIKLLKASRIYGGKSEPCLFSLPLSLKFLYLSNCNIKHDKDAKVAFHATSFFRLCLDRNSFEFLPNSIDFKTLRTLNLNYCLCLKSLPCIPSTLEELYVDNCYLLEKITFQSGRFSLQQFSYVGCYQLSEVEGLFKLVPITNIKKEDLAQHMQWIKTYEDYSAFLVGDGITKNRIRNIQMLNEYGIMSTYLQGIKDQSTLTFKSTSSSNHLSFYVPSQHENNMIQGLHVSCLYRSSGYKDDDMRQWLAKISNKTKGLSWVYNPMVYCEPDTDEDVVWLSYWPFGNILDAGDEVHVDIIVDEGVIVSECGANVVYMDGEVEQEEICETSTMKGEQVIGGDLSKFEVATKGYYLCHRDLFGLDTSSRLKELFGDNVSCSGSQGWKRTHRSSMRNYIADMMRYDIFLSYRSEDTSYSFTNHLYQRLSQAGFRVFRDSDSRERGQEPKPEIETVIIASRASIVVFSENYANSKRCMEELCLINEQWRNYNHFVLLVFYHVDPSDVEIQRGSFAIDRSELTMDDLRQWERALTMVALLGIEAFGSRDNQIPQSMDFYAHHIF